MEISQAIRWCCCCVFIFYWCIATVWCWTHTFTSILDPQSSTNHEHKWTKTKSVEFIARRTQTQTQTQRESESRETSKQTQCLFFRFFPIWKLHFCMFASYKITMPKHIAGAMRERVSNNTRHSENGRWKTMKATREIKSMSKKDKQKWQNATGTKTCTNTHARTLFTRSRTRTVIEASCGFNPLHMFTVDIFGGKFVSSRYSFHKLPAK